jgi:hypothetical protein
MPLQMKNLGAAVNFFAPDDAAWQRAIRPVMDKFFEPMLPNWTFV